MKHAAFIIRPVAALLLALTCAFCLASCSGGKKNVPDELYTKLQINIRASSGKKYLIHFLKEGTDVASAYASEKDTAYITFSSSPGKGCEIDLQKEFDSFAGIMKKSSDLKIVLSSEDDPFIRNPLSDEYKLRLYVVEGENGQPVIMSPVNSIELSVSADKEGSGISLAFPNASFIIKLDVSETGIELRDDTKFEVFLTDETTGKSVGRVCRGFNYWEAPFYKSEIASKTLTLEIREFGSEKVLPYDDSPMTFQFNDQGLCSQGSVIRIRLAAQEE